MALIALLAKLWPWIIVFLVWYYINRALDRIDAAAAKRKASKFWKRFWWLWGWAIGAQSKLAVVRWLLIGIALYLLFRWFAISISTPVAGI